MWRLSMCTLIYMTCIVDEYDNEWEGLKVYGDDAWCDHM